MGAIPNASESSQSASVPHHEADHPVLRAMIELTAELKIYLLLGSIAVRADCDVDTDDATRRIRSYNRSYLISPTGSILCAYDKIHLFQANLSSSQSYDESIRVAAGNKTKVAKLPFGNLGTHRSMCVTFTLYISFDVVVFCMDV